MPLSTTDATREMRERLSEVEADLIDLREQRAAAQATADAARSKFASARKLEVGSALYRSADSAVDALNKITDEVTKAEQRQVELLKLLGEGGVTKGRRLGRVDLSAPGGWMANEIRRKSLTTSDIGTVEQSGRVFFDRLRAASALLASGVQTLDLTTSSIRVPTLTGRLAPAVPVPELAPIPEDTPPFESVEIKPPKYSKLVVLSTEALDDALPIQLAVLERELISSIADGFDAAAFGGARDSVQPGIVSTPGIISISATGGFNNLDAVVQAKAALRAVGAEATAVYANPLDWQTAELLKISADSNAPLVAASNSIAGAPPSSVLGVKVFQSVAVPRHKLIVAQASELLVVRRTDVEVDVDRFYRFSEAASAYRTIARLALVVPQPTAVAVISLPTS